MKIKPIPVNPDVKELTKVILEQNGKILEANIEILQLLNAPSYLVGKNIDIKIEDL